MICNANERLGFAGEFIQQLLHGREGILAVLEAFCDETESPGKPSLTCVGGYIFEPEKATLFSEKWEDVLKPLRALGVRYFHASACDYPEKPFCNLRDSERLALFGDLISLVRSTAKFGVVSGIDDDTFRQVMERNKIQRYVGTKYTVCAMRNMSFLGHWAENHKYTGEIVYLFEAGHASMKEASDFMDQIADSSELRRRYRYGGHGFLSKTAMPPLQAADLLVWLWQKAWIEKVFGPYLKSLLRKPGQISHYVSHLSDTSLNLLGLVNMFYGLESELYEQKTANPITF